MKHSRRDSAQWKQLDGLLDAVLELPSDQRSAFLDQACAGDDALRKEIDRLLAHDERVGSFIESPAFHASSPEIDTSHLASLLKGEPEREPLFRAGHLVAERYQILSRLGKGGMGEVWHAYDLKLRIDVALKSLRLDLHQRPEDLVELIRREVRTAREVISPNVCRIFDLVSEEDQELISMEYIDGITLLEMMEKRGPLDLRQARDIAAQFLAGLEAVHAAGLVHRDLKPENIMITRTGRVVVMDLGIAEHVAQTGSAISGTVPYMSPEQLAGEKIDERSDIFSAGVVLAEMIHTRGMLTENTREQIWKAVREDPMQLPESPWKAEFIDVDPSGTHVLAATPGDGVHLITIANAELLQLKGMDPNKAYSSVSFSPDGKSAAAAASKGIEIWDLQSGKSRILEQSKEVHFPCLKYAPDGTLLSGDGTGKLYHWNLNDDSMRILGKGTGFWVTGIAVSNDGRYIAAVTSSAKNVFELPGANSELLLYNLKSGESTPISSHGNRVFCVAFDPGATRLVTGDIDGIVRVGPITGETPHLLLGHSNTVKDVVVHPGGQWIASTEFDSVVRLCQMPEGEPLETLPQNEFLNHLRAQTNVRVVADKDSPSGYRIQYQPFSGWKPIARW